MSPGQMKFRFARCSPETRNIAFTAESVQPAAELPLTLEFDGDVSAREQAIFLLHTAAEIEHALMVQYLFAAYSLGGPQVPEEHRRTIEGWKQRLLQIAREEMGHLASVQNILRLIDAPLNLEREDFPFRGDFYPFHFMLEPLTRESLAKYVAAESPETVPGDEELLRDIRELAEEQNEDMPVNRVGALFVKLRQLFGDPSAPPSDKVLSNDDFRGDPDFLLTEREWGFRNLIVKPSPPAERGGTPLPTDATGIRQACINALLEIGEQGEAHDLNDSQDSHFEIFRDIFVELSKFRDSDGQMLFEPARPVASVPMTENSPTGSLISNPRSRLWAQLLDQRYELMLGFLWHFLQLNDKPYIGQDDIDAAGSTLSQDQLGDRTPRGFLLLWTFNEMRHIRKISEHLVRLPLGNETDEERAGPPFRLPRSLELRANAAEQWQAHADRIAVAIQIAERLQEEHETTRDTPSGNLFLVDLIQADRIASETMNALAANELLPAQRKDFAKAVSILNESVRGFNVRLPPDEAGHGNFWADRPRSEVVGDAGERFLIDPETDRDDPESSELIRVLTEEEPSLRMPRNRPPVPAERIEFLKWWIGAGSPDSDPPEQVGVALEREVDLPVSEPDVEPPSGHVSLTLKRVVDGLNRPLFAVSPPGDGDRLFVVEQHTGNIRIVDLSTNSIRPQPFLRIAGLGNSNEQGLLGLAFHPEYSDNGLFYVNFTERNGTTSIRRYRASSTDANEADPDSATTVLKIAQPQRNHNGGWIGFGPDGFLYIATGDGGGGFDLGRGHNPTIGNAQDITNNLLGKLLRVDVAGDDFPGEDRSYAIPRGNPFADRSGDGEIWAFGLRNPWRCSFDRQTGDLYIGDVGQHAWEEINFQPANSTGGENYGWRLREGLVATPVESGANVGGPRPVGAIDPIHVYPRGSGAEEGQAVVGGYVYRGAAIPDLLGTYFFADHLGKVWSFRYDGAEITEFENRTAELASGAESLSRIASFGEDDAGELYLCDFRGILFRLERE